MRFAVSTLFVVAAAVLAGAPALAQDAKAGKDNFLRADANADGSVTFEELSAARPNVTPDAFKRLDRNGDGVISRADRQQKAAGPDSVERIRRCDTNHDGRVTFEEFSAGFPKATRERFDALDRNKDAALTPEDAPRENAKDREGQQTQARQQMAARLRKADADGDGKATFEEVAKAKPGFPRRDFDRYDTDKDGALTEKDALPGRAPKTQEGAGKKLRAADSNADNRVSFDEAKAAIPNLTHEEFRRHDRNADGFISKEDRSKP